MKRYLKVKRSISLLLIGVMLILMSISSTAFAEGETINQFDENMVYELADTANYKSASEGTTSDGKDAIFVVDGNVTYTIPAVPETGWYMVSVTTKAVAKKAYTITATAGDASWAITNNGSVAARNFKIASFFLEEGTPEDITFSFSSFASGLTSVTLTSIEVARKNDISVSATDDTIIRSMDYTNRVFREGSVDEESETWGNNTTGAEINWEKGKVVIDNPNGAKRYGIYNINVEKKATYNVYLLTSSTSDTANCKVDFYVDGEEKTKSTVQITNTALNTATIYDSVATVELDKGHHELKFQFAKGGGSTYFLGIKLSPVITETKPVVTLSGIDGEILDRVCDGTMNVKVDLNGCGKDSVYFVIYEETNGAKEIYKICKATITDDVAEGTITEIAQKAGKNYLAKVFVWEYATMLGYAYSF